MRYSHGCGFSRRVCGSSEECRRCRAVLPSPGGELDREAVLVTVSSAGAFDASERLDEAADGAAYDGLLGYEGPNSPAMANRTNS